MPQKLPEWFRQKISTNGAGAEVSHLLNELGLPTVCQSARCPNLGQCFSRGTATFMILGSVCTRCCTFCAVGKGQPSAVDPTEPVRLAEAVKRLKLRYVVVTSVTRDDLPDGGAGHFAAVLERLHAELPEVKTEVLVPDFQGSHETLRRVLDAHPAVLAHNLETVPRLYLSVRPQASYLRSLDLLAWVKQTAPPMTTKSGLMLGLGETEDEVLAAMQDLRQAGCDLLTLGQYLSPGPRHHPVVNFITPEEFASYVPIGLEMGFKGVASAPLVRSSYKADELYSLHLN